MIVVTGSKGFIGQHLSRRFSNIIEVDMHNCDDAIKYIDWHNVTGLYHLGAISDTTEKDYEKIYRYNIDYSIKLLDWVSRGTFPVVYASSAAVYGNGEGPLNYYAMSKATVDLWVKDNIKRFATIRGYRFFNVYGPGEQHKGNQASPLHKFIKEAKEIGKIRIFEDQGDGCRDFIHVNDVVNTMINDKRQSGIYDLGTGTSLKFSEVAGMVAKKYNAEIEIIPFPDHLKGKYQYYTKSSIVNDTFVTVEQYLDSIT